MTELRAIAAALNELPDGDPGRERLLKRRDRIHDAARSTADGTRDPAILAYELVHLRRRLAELDGERIGESWPERGNRHWINDPSAYARGINRELDAKTEEERAFLEERIAQLEASLEDANDRSRSNG